MTGSFEFLYQYADAVALLTLSAVGLLIVFGMMGVINMAHGELMMAGAFSTAYAYQAGLPVPLAVIVGGVAAGALGIVLERLVIRFLYSRLLYSLVATWGISLVLSQGALIVLGPSARGLPSVLGSFTVGGVSFAYYPMVLFLIAVLIVAGLWALLRFTSFGIDARATMSDPDMALALGVNTRWMYMATFGLGSFLAGLAGGLYSLTAPVQPNFGAAFTPIAFIVVVVAGARNIIVGLIASVLLLGLVKTLLTINVNILSGHVAMLLTAFVVIRALPNGLNELLGRLGRTLRRQASTA
jgi:branched-chain amino acid transport system permease protein